MLWWGDGYCQYRKKYEWIVVLVPVAVFFFLMLYHICTVLVTANTMTKNKTKTKTIVHAPDQKVEHWGNKSVQRRSSDIRSTATVPFVLNLLFEKSFLLPFSSSTFIDSSSNIWFILLWKSVLTCFAIVIEVNVRVKKILRLVDQK